MVRGCPMHSRSARWSLDLYGARGFRASRSRTPASRALVIAACRSECGLMWRGMPATFAILVAIRYASRPIGLPATVDRIFRRRGRELETAGVDRTHRNCVLCEPNGPPEAHSIRPLSDITTGARVADVHRWNHADGALLAGQPAGPAHNPSVALTDDPVRVSARLPPGPSARGSARAPSEPPDSRRPSFLQP